MQTELLYHYRALYSCPMLMRDKNSRFPGNFVWKRALTHLELIVLLIVIDKLVRLCDVLVARLWKETTSWRRLLYNFSQNTTFHGVRYITADTQFVIRR